MVSLKITIYEFLGFLIPGFLLVIALWVFGWAIFLPNQPLRIEEHSLTKEDVALLLFCSYMLGHVIQGTCTHLLKLKFPKQVRKEKYQRKQAIGALKTHFSIAVANKSMDQLKTLARALLLHAEKPETDDVDDLYESREGFYRGSSTGAIFLALAWIFYIFRAQSLPDHDRIVIGPTHFGIGPAWLLFALACVSGFIFHFRYRRYHDLVLENLLSFAVIPEKPGGHPGDSEPGNNPHHNSPLAPESGAPAA